MILDERRTVDPRSNLHKATRYEVYRFAKANNVAEITSEGMPKKLMISILRSRGITNIQIPARKLGALNFPQGRPGGGAAAAPPAPDGDVEVDEDADLARQWASQQAAPVVAAPAQVPAVDPPAKAPAHMSINELGAEMKRLGIHRERRDNMITMRAKIEERLKANG
jgi:hypothetical protein